MGEQKFKVSVSECSLAGGSGALPLAAAFFAAALSISADFKKISKGGRDILLSVAVKDRSNIAVLVTPNGRCSFLGFIFIFGKTKITLAESEKMADYVFKNSGENFIEEINWGKVYHAEASFSIVLPGDFIRSDFMFLSKKATFYTQSCDCCEVFYIDKKDFKKNHVKECSLNAFRASQHVFVPWFGLYSIAEENGREFLFCRTRHDLKGKTVFFDSFVLSAKNGVFIVNVGGNDEDVFNRLNSREIALSLFEGEFLPLDKTEHPDKIAIVRLEN